MTLLNIIFTSEVIGHLEICDFVHNQLLLNDRFDKGLKCFFIYFLATVVHSSWSHSSFVMRDQDCIIVYVVLWKL